MGMLMNRHRRHYATDPGAEKAPGKVAKKAVAKKPAGTKALAKASPVDSPTGDEANSDGKTPNE